MSKASRFVRSHDAINWDNSVHIQDISQWRNLIFRRRGFGQKKFIVSFTPEEDEWVVVFHKEKQAVKRLNLLTSRTEQSELGIGLASDLLRPGGTTGANTSSSLSSPGSNPSASDEMTRVWLFHHDGWTSRGHGSVQQLLCENLKLRRRAPPRQSSECCPLQ